MPANGAAATANGERPVTKKWAKKEKGLRNVGLSTPELAVPLLSVSGGERAGREEFCFNLVRLCFMYMYVHVRSAGRKCLPL